MSSKPQGDVKPLLDAFLSELQPANPAGLTAEPVPVKLSPAYTAEAMLQLMVDHPTWTHSQFAAHFGRTAGWFASVLASDHFQAALQPRRHEIADPSLTASLEERYRALALRSAVVLQERLASPSATEFLILKSAEISLKALCSPKGDGMGEGKNSAPPPPANKSPTDLIAERLLAAYAMRNEKLAVDGTATKVEND